MVMDHPWLNLWFLGILYFIGMGVPYDLDKALHYLTLAEKGKNATIGYNLGS